MLLVGDNDIAIKSGAAETPAPLLSISYMGCRIDDYCYPPQRITIPLTQGAQ